MGAAEDCSFGAQPYKPDCKHFNRPLAATQRAKETDMQTDVALGLSKALVAARGLARLDL